MKIEKHFKKVPRQFHYLTSAPPSVLEESETLIQRASANELELIHSLKPDKMYFRQTFYDKDFETKSRK